MLVLYINNNMNLYQMVYSNNLFIVRLLTIMTCFIYNKCTAKHLQKPIFLINYNLLHLSIKNTYICIFGAPLNIVSLKSVPRLKKFGNPCHVSGCDLPFIKRKIHLIFYFKNICNSTWGEKLIKLAIYR